MGKLKCEFCGKEKEEFSFMIGASLKPDWCMIEGTGKIACPDCYKKAAKEGSDRIDEHIKNHNAKCEIYSEAKKTTEEKYWDMLEVLPPIYVSSINGIKINGFAVGEASGHSGKTSVYDVFYKKDGKHYETLCEVFTAKDEPINYTELHTWSKGNKAEIYKGKIEDSYNYN